MALGDARPAPAGDVAGAVLVGGASRRMGRDKATLPWGSATMGGRSVDALERAGCRPVVAVGGQPDIHEALAVELVADLYPGEGPLGGIITALRRFPGRFVAVVACDLPWLEPDVVRSLADACRRATAADVALALTDRPQPLLAVWAPTALPALIRVFEEGERAMHGALRGLTAVTVAARPEVVRNVNSPADVPRHA